LEAQRAKLSQHGGLVFGSSAVASSFQRLGAGTLGLLPSSLVALEASHGAEH